MFFKQILKLIAPHTCRRCGATGELVCRDCLPYLDNPRAETCYNCNRLSPSFRTCSRCRKQSQLYRVVVASQYDGLVKELIRYLKYENGIDATTPLARLLATKLVSLEQSYDVITWAPTTARSFRRRGYNQAAELARALARLMDLPCIETGYKAGRLRQVGADRKQRLIQVRGSIKLRSTDRVKGLRVLLVDDVVTTGATLNECARLLRAGGAKRVDAVVVAKH
ncbi:MAG: phosphoribosyltransferase family protein [Candidatus Saccharimonadales bacterium]